LATVNIPNNTNTTVRNISLYTAVLLIEASNDLRAWLVSLNGRSGYSLSPSYFGPHKIDGVPRVWVVQKPKIKIFLVRKEWGPQNVREPEHELAAAEKKLRNLRTFRNFFIILRE
jgi:hypothetical protein